ncbi:MAG: hypothetical protein MJ213_05500 [Bacilli bacterium]|nr:hypothetical protein [Bacilli bacterium]
MEVIIIKNELIDAVKTAKSIHDGNYSSLRGKYFVIRGKIKKNEGRDKHVNRSKPKYTLNQIGDALFEFIKTTNENFKQVNSRIDGIDARLDYIVKANNLKDNK